MKDKFKFLIKKTIPATVIEFFFPRKVGITKFPRNKSVISDLFIFRIEENWVTYFELLNIQQLFSPNNKRSTSSKATVFFFNCDGIFINAKEVDLMNEMKATININELAKELKIKQDGLFSVFHDNPPAWFERYNSLLAERGYTGYVNPTKGNIKGYVHGNLDSISFSKTKKIELLGQKSFKLKEYHLQHLLKANIAYELFFVNPSNKQLIFEIIEYYGTSSKTKRLKIPPGGVRKYIKSICNSKDDSRIVIKSKLSLARPIVFKYMETSFDIFHG